MVEIYWSALQKLKLTVVGWKDIPDYYRYSKWFSYLVSHNISSATAFLLASDVRILEISNGIE